MSNIFQETLAKNLKIIRNNKNLTQFELAELCETSTNYIALIETCKKFPSSNMLTKIVEALHIEPFELFLTEQDVKKEVNKSLLKKEINKVIDKIL